MRFRTALSVTFLLLLAVTLGAVVAAVSVVLERSARGVLTRDLQRDHAAFVDMLQYRKSLHRSESRVVADEPRLKAVVATDDVTPATVVGVMSDLRRAMRCDLLLLTDRHGVLVADAAHPDDSGIPLGDVAVVATALQTGESAGVWIDGAQVFQVHGRRISYGALTVGAVVIGYRIDDALADLVGRHIGAGVALMLDGQVVATSRRIGDTELSPDALSASLPAVLSRAARAPQVVALHGQRYLLIAGPLPDYVGRQQLQVVLLRSLDGAMASAHQLVRVLLGIAALALALAVCAALLLSRRLSRPIDDLVGFAQRIAGGNLQTTAVTGMKEVRTLGDAMNKMVGELATSRAHIAEKTRMARELEIAQRIQTSILPREVQVPGLTLTAQMVPASEVGGDYYDVIPCKDGCWLGVGDVAGHGLSAGLVMLMVQSAFAALVRTMPDATPRQLVIALNRLVYENVRNRLQADEHVTFTAFRYFSDGRMLFAGAHEPLVVLRQASGRPELVETPGTWLGVVPDISKATTDSQLQLARGDVVVLYSDGVIESTNAEGGQLGMDRLLQEVACGAVGSSASVEHSPAVTRSTTEIHHHLMDIVRNWSKEPEDDVTLLVLRHQGLEGTE